MPTTSLVPAESGKPGVVVVDLASPYILTKAGGEATGADAVEVSTDGGKTFKAVDLKDFTAAVRGHVAAQVKIVFKKALKSLKLEAVVQNNSGALPYLSPGKNVVTVSVADPEGPGRQPARGHLRLSVGQPQQVVRADVRRRQGDRQGARRHLGQDRHLRAEDVRRRRLAGEFEIDCPTPKGRYPVYPRMVFVRREVLAPGQSPAALPSPATTPKVRCERGTGDAAQPWLIGTLLPPSAPAKATSSLVLPVKRVSYVSKKGQVFKHQFVKWPKDNSDAWIMLVGFDADKLPKVEELASAKLVLYVDEAHDKAPMQVAAVMLDAPFEADEPFDFAKLGQNVGSTIVEKGNGASFSPPRRCEIDVTRAVRAWASGGKCHGLAVRIVPNRGVDDGWTVRFTPARDKPAELAIATYAGK